MIGPSEVPEVIEVEPPAPFAGRALYLRIPGLSPNWTGDLSALNPPRLATRTGLPSHTEKRDVKRRAQDETQAASIRIHLYHRAAIPQFFRFRPFGQETHESLALSRRIPTLRDIAPRAAGNPSQATAVRPDRKKIAPHFRLSTTSVNASPSHKRDLAAIRRIHGVNCPAQEHRCLPARQVDPHHAPRSTPRRAARQQILPVWRERPGIHPNAVALGRYAPHRATEHVNCPNARATCHKFLLPTPVHPRSELITRKEDRPTIRGEFGLICATGPF